VDVSENNFDRVQQKCKRQKKSLGLFLSELNEPEEPEVEEEAEQEAVSPRQRPVMNVLMQELSRRVVPLRHVEAQEPAKPKNLPPPKTESELNVERLNFQVPQQFLNRVTNQRNRTGQFVRDNDLESQYDLLEELEVSYDRLIETNQALVEIWKTIERMYFDEKRTEYLRTISNPEFMMLSDIVDDWGYELPNVIWAIIWEFRAPLEKKIDLRFALETFKLFESRYGL